MKLRHPFLAALLIAACGRALPSSTSLGGKLDDELSDTYTPDRRAPDADAGGTPREVAEATEVDAGASDAGSAAAELSDAGAPDAAEAGSAVPEVVRWAGEYVGSDLTTTRLQGMPDRVQPDDKARTRVEEKGTGRIALIIVDSSNGNTLCTLNASAQGASATIDPNQDCFSTEEADVTVERGSAELRGDRLIFDLEASLEAEAGDVKLEGSIEYHFDGKRQ